MSTAQEALAGLCINTIRFLSADAVENAKSGHPGMPMGAAAMAYTLWTQFLKHNPKNPKWCDRDRFVLSAGHGSMLLYSLLHLTGYDLSLDDLKHFRQWGSLTPGHPEFGHTAGVEATTGPLGQGFANGVGMAMAEAWLAARYNRPGHTIVDHYTYAICGDGDLMEGITCEATSLAGHLQLGKLIYLYDNNHISLAGATSLCFTEDVGARFRACGWHTVGVDDGNDVAAIAQAIEEAKKETARPSLILVRTHIGFGSPKKQDTSGAHGSPLGEDELLAAKKALGWPGMDKFYLPAEAVQSFRTAVAHGAAADEAWQARFEAYRAQFRAEAAEFEHLMAGKLADGWDQDLPQWPASGKPMATRVAGGEVMNALAKKIPNLVGGSADLNPSTNTALKGKGDFQPESTPAGAEGAVGGPWGPSGNNMAFGVREHAMGAAVNGMALHGGVIPFSATFFVFSDYMKPALRLGAISKLKAIYVFTHDSIGVGEDGPTHEPVEQLAGLRCIPGLAVVRPADANETADAWKFALRRNGPTAIVLARQNGQHLDRSGATEPGVERGAYILMDATGTPDVILIGTGTEVALCAMAREKLAAYGVQARVVSMPCMSQFSAQPAEYREAVLPRAIAKRVTVEAGTTFGWDRFAGDSGVMIGLDRFGASAPGDVVLRSLGFTVGAVSAAALRLCGRNGDAEKESANTDTAMAGPTLAHK